MRIGIIGGRDRHVTFQEIRSALPCPLELVKKIISGGAQGVDTCAKEFAQHYGIPLEEHLPEYHEYGKNAPLERNRTIVERSDMIIAFPGSGKGTMHTVGLARQAGVPVVLRHEGHERQQRLF